MFAGSIPGSLMSVRKQSPGHARVIKPASGRQRGWSRWCHRGGMSVGLHRQCSVPPARTRTRAHTRIRAHTHTHACALIQTGRHTHRHVRACTHAIHARACTHTVRVHPHTRALPHTRRHTRACTQVRSRTSHADTRTRRCAHAPRTHTDARTRTRRCAQTRVCTHRLHTRAHTRWDRPGGTPSHPTQGWLGRLRRAAWGGSPRGPGCGAASPGRSHPTVTPAPLPSRTLPGGLRAGTGRTRVLAVPPVGPRLRREVGQSRLLPTQPGLEPGFLRGTTHPPKIPPPFSRHTPRGRTWPRRPLGVVVQPVVDCAGSGSG